MKTKCLKMAMVISLIAIATFAVNAQVTIGSNQAPDANAVLDLQSDKLGFLPPRVELTNLYSPIHVGHTLVEGLVVYNKKPSPNDTLEVGLYYCKRESNGFHKWERLVNQSEASSTPFTPLWFYAPSFPLDVTEGTHTVNLFDKYKEQLTNDDNIIKSHSLPIPVSYSTYTAGDLHYYITGYDKSVFQFLTLNDMGILHYTITDESVSNVSDTTYMNIVFSVKR